MRKLLTILFILIGFAGFAQPIVNRAGQANTVQDARLAAQYNFFLPRYSDTTSANTQKGIDTCGALIFTYDYNGFWYRQCSPKKWVQIFANSPSPSSDTLVWKLSGNSVGLRQATPVLGTLDGYDLNFMTNGATRLSIPSGGLVRNSAATVKYLSFDTITKQMYYGDGGTPSTPTWQQTLTAGSTLTTDNTIDIEGNELIFSNGGTIELSTVNGVTSSTIIESTGSSIGLQASGSTANYNSAININTDSIKLFPHLGRLSIDTLLNRSNQNALMGWDSTGTDRGQVGYVTLGSGLSLSSGVLSSSGGTPGGSDTYIQFNDGGSFGGDAGFTYNKTTNVFSTNNGAYRPTGTISFSDAGAGSVYKSSSDGLVLRAVTGSGYDFMIYDASGAGIFGNQTGTSQLGSTSQMGAGLLGYGSWNAWMNLRGGTTTNASLTIRDGVAPSSPAEGQIWRTTDKVYNVIQTGAATKEFTLNDIALTSGRIPYTTTNGRLTDTATFLRSPGGNVGIGTSSPTASALLDVSSTTKGVLIPRMTTTERNAISTPSVGLMIYNTTDSAFNYYRLSGWTAIGGGGGSSLFPTTGTGTATGSIVADMASQSVTVTHTTGGAATNAFRPYKVYTALLTQSGTSAPTVDALLENTLGGSISWAYTSAGTYDGTLSGAFLSNKVFGINGIAGIDDTQVAAYTIQRIDNNTIRIQCSIYPSIGLSDNVLSATSIEIRVYY